MLKVIAVVTAILLAGASAPGLTQTRPMVDVAAGVAGGRGGELGVAAQVAFELRPIARLPIGVRVDVSHHQWHEGFLTSHETIRGTAATLDLVYRLPTMRVRPYILTGIGAYAVQGEGLSPGWNLGGGLEVPIGRHSLFGEIRSHFLSTESNARLTPFVVGVRF